jgi:hypothetical protein
METIEYLLHDLPGQASRPDHTNDPERGPTHSERPKRQQGMEGSDERTPLLPNPSLSFSQLFRYQRDRASNFSYNDQRSASNASEDTSQPNPYASFRGLNALEIATVANAKKFLSQKVVQKIINDVWNGEIMFWDNLSVHSRKKPRVISRRYGSIMLPWLWYYC